MKLQTETGTPLPLTFENLKTEGFKEVKQDGQPTKWVKKKKTVFVDVAGFYLMPGGEKTYISKMEDLL